MSKMGIFYGTTTGVTEDIAGRLAEYFSDADVYEISGNENRLTDYDILLIGTSTWGFGDLQDDWLNILNDLSSLDLSGKKIAYFGLGDQSTFADTFIDGVAIIHDELKNTGAEFIGAVSTEGYEFAESRSVVNGKFLGLAIDEVNQPDLTDERIANWVEQLKNEI